ncbi:MAG: DoxX family membrane protein [Candidatus Peregrinibacteria bacterium]
MLKNKKDLLLLLGRVLLSAIFLFSAYSKMINIPDTVAYMESAGLGGGVVLAWVAALIELLGGLMLLLGLCADKAALVLAVYLLVVSCFFHLEITEGTQTFHLLKNLAIIGGLLNVVASGGGSYTLKKHGCCN